MQKIIKLIKKAKNIALFSHISPDPDTIGSTLALYLALKKYGKKVSVFCDDENNEKYGFLQYYDRYNTDDVNADYDLAIAVDVPVSEKLGSYLERFKEIKNHIRFDHHISGENYGNINIMYPYSACSILVFELIKKLRIKIDPTIATLLYFAICGDTGIFKYTNTDSKTFLVASKLLKYGADYRQVYEKFFDKYDKREVMLRSSAILSAEFNDVFGYAVMCVTKKDCNKYGVEAGGSLNNTPHTFLNCGYKIAAILQEEDLGIHCSLRSKFDFDCNIIAQKFGGGGHKNASGFIVDDKIENVKELVKKEIENYLTQKGEN